VALLADEQGAVVVERDGDVGVIVAEQLLFDRERAPVERVDARGLAGSVGDRREAVRVMATS
jgi:hypothetical protein